MNKIIKYTLIGCGVVMTLVITVVVIFALTFDPNDYKDEIATLVKSKTGRTLTIQGDLHLTFFPWIGVESGAIILGNAAGFGPEPFARMDSVKISIKLLPLFKKQVELDTVKLYGLKVSLVKNSQGINNWNDLVAAANNPTSATTNTQPSPHQTTSTSSSQALPVLAGLSIGGLDIRDAEMKWQDQQNHTGLVISNINLKSDVVSLDKPTALELSFEMQNQQPAIKGTFDLTTTLNINVEQKHLQAAHTRLKSHVEGNIIPGQKMDASLEAVDISADMDKQLLDITSLTLESLGASVSGEIHAKQFIDNPFITGTVKLDEFNPRAVLQQLGVNLPATSDPKVLTNATLDIKFDASQKDLDIKQIAGQLDDTHLTGNVSIKNFSTPAIAFKLDIDEVDLDRYLSPSTKSAAATPATAATAGALELPLETLRTLNLDGTARLGKLKVANLSTNDIGLTASAHNGLIKLFPISAKLYGGTYKGHVELDATGKEPVFSFDEQLSNLQVDPFLHDLVETDFISGVANAGIKITTHGNSIDDLRKTLNGTMTFSASDGRIDGLNLLGSLQQDYVKYAKAMTADDKSLNQTVFSKFGGNVSIKNGLANTQDTQLVSSQLDATAKGTADLVTEKLNLTLEIVPKKELAKLLKGLGNKPIPYYITGTFSQPQFKNGLSDLVKQLGQEKLDEEKAKINAELKARKKQEEEKIRKKAQDQVKDKLKDILKF